MNGNLSQMYQAKINFLKRKVFISENCREV